MNLFNDSVFIVQELCADYVGIMDHRDASNQLFQKHYFCIFNRLYHEWRSMLIMKMVKNETKLKHWQNTPQQIIRLAKKKKPLFWLLWTKFIYILYTGLFISGPFWIFNDYLSISYQYFVGASCHSWTNFAITVRDAFMSDVKVFNVTCH